MHIPSPRAPAIIALNKNTGKLVWEDNSVEDRILHGQWSTPTVGTHRRRRSGDLRRRATAGFAATRRPPARSCGSSTPIPRIPSGRKRATRSFPRRSSTRIACTSPTGRIRSTARASDTSTRSTRPSAATSPRRAASFTSTRSAGRSPLPRLPTASSTSRTSAGSSTASTPKPGSEYWVHDLTAAVWGSALVADGKIYLGNEDGDVLVMQAGKEKKVLGDLQHGDRGLRHGGARAQHAVHHEPQSALRPRGEVDGFVRRSVFGVLR